jgi:ABC-type transport system involved in cytochrome c biogenesis permease subunit
MIARRLIPGLLMVVLLTGLAFAQDPHAGHQAPPLKAAPSVVWTEAMFETLSTLPVQDGGRIKPFSTYARFKLLGMNGRSSVKLEGDRKLTATQWMADCLFAPETAKTYPMFYVRNDEVLDAIGVEHEGRKKTERYSYAEIAPQRQTLIKRYQEYAKIDEKKRDSVETQVLHLGSSIFQFEELIVSVDRMRSMRMFGREFAIFPPAGDDPQWLTPNEMVKAAIQPDSGLDAQMVALQKLVDIAAAPENAEKPLSDLHASIVGLATGRGEYGKVEMEVTYYKSGFFHWGLGFFAIGFVCVAFCWLVPRLRPLYWVSSLSVLTATIATTVGITYRCIIQGRPPVTTLYETILFVTATLAITALVIEWMNRRRLALSLAAVLGMGGLFLAMRYENFRGADTMPSLIAVLDTNFWLATHVTTVTLGYSAGLLACAIAHVYVIGRAFTPWGKEQSYKSITRMVYGVICFGLFFSTLGTILGGIWANDSWGRFWGWDPKENGALMIVLWELAMLHARKGGYLKDFGFSLAAIFGGIVVAFSWWGVNQLGVGLHSYGFTSGIQLILYIFYGFELLVITVAGVAFFAGRKAAEVVSSGD